MRFFRELFKPALKCERVGHRTAVEVRERYVKPSSGDRGYYVCVEVQDERAICSRCDAVLGEWVEAWRKGFTSYSWPSDMARKFDRDGEYESRRYVR